MRRHRRCSLLPVLVAVLVLACATYQPPTPARERPGLTVAASVDRTWDATVAWLTAQALPLQAADRAGGVLTTAPVPLTVPDTLAVADCGTYGGHPWHADRVSVSATVQGDAAAATVRLVARYTIDTPPGSPARVCQSRGTWEAVGEATIRERAEAGAGGREEASRHRVKLPGA